MDALPAGAPSAGPSLGSLLQVPAWLPLCTLCAGAVSASIVRTKKSWGLRASSAGSWEASFCSSEHLLRLSLYRVLLVAFGARRLLLALSHAEPCILEALAHG